MSVDNKIGDAFAAALSRFLDLDNEEGRAKRSQRSKAGRKPTITAAAKELGVSRQTLHSYLRGTLPRRKTLNRAVHIWGLRLDLGEYAFDKGAFGRLQSKETHLPRQITLWEALDSVKEEDLHVTMKRLGKVLRVDVRIEIPA